MIGKPAEFADFIVAFNGKWSKVITADSGHMAA
jgi:hypothetical protein